MIKRFFALSLILLLGSSLLNPESMHSAGSGNETIRLLLVESHSIGIKLEGVASQVYYLTHLTRVAAGIAPSDTVKKWCENLFEASLRLPGSTPASRWNRIADEKNALMALSKIDAQAAMDLFPRVEDPVAGPDGIFPEDVRAYAANTIFSNYWKLKGEQALPGIESQAIHIGETGEYPYRAMGFIVTELAKSQSADGKTRADKVFSQALQYYTRPSIYRNNNLEFLVFLENTQFASSDANLFLQAVHSLVDHLVNEPPGQERIHVEVETKKGVSRFSERNRWLLFRAFPLISQVDPSGAQKLLQKYPELNRAGEIQYSGGGMVVGDGTQQEINQTFDRLAQLSLLSKIQSLQQTNPQTAFGLTQKLTVPGLRVIGFSTILPGLISSDSSRATLVYAQQLKELDNLKNADRLRGLVALAQAAYYMEDSNNFYAFCIQALDEGTRSFGLDLSGSESRPESRAGYNELVQMVGFGVEHGANWLVDKVRQIKDPELKAHLLIAAAEGLASQESLSRSFVTRLDWAQ